jgi:hypothetical protein
LRARRALTIGAPQGLFDVRFEGSKMKFILSSLAAAGGLLVASTAIAAQSQDAAVDALLECRKIENAEARLACMDDASETISETRFAPAPAALEAKPAIAADDAFEQSSDDEFGAENVKEKRKKAESQRQNQLEAKIIEVFSRRNRGVIVTLDNGQKWRQLDSDDRSVRFTGKNKLYTARIKRGPMGNYLMRINELKRSIRVERIE